MLCSLRRREPVKYKTQPKSGKKKHFQQKKTYRIISSFDIMCHTQFRKKKEIEQKKPFLIIQVFNSLKLHHFRWSTSIIMAKPLWRLGIYYVSDSSHILTFTQCCGSRFTGHAALLGVQPPTGFFYCRLICSRIGFQNQLVDHISILYFPNFLLLYLQKMIYSSVPWKVFFLVKGFLCSKRLFFLQKRFIASKIVASKIVFFSFEVCCNCLIGCTFFKVF